jgi:hypothetical protein
MNLKNDNLGHADDPYSLAWASIHDEQPWLRRRGHAKASCTPPKH